MTKMRDVPEFLEAFKLLESDLPSLYTVFDIATGQARDFFDEKDVPFEPGLHASLTRAFALKQFSTSLHPMPWQMDTLNNNGMKMQKGGFFVRARKSLDGSVPKSPSKKFNNYLWQIQEGQKQLSEEFGKPYNLLLLWEADYQGILSRLSLVYPLNPINVRWRCDIPRPIRSTSSNSAGEGQRPPTNVPGELYIITATQPSLFADELDIEGGELEIEFVGQDQALTEDEAADGTT